MQTSLSGSRFWHVVNSQIKLSSRCSSGGSRKLKFYKNIPKNTSPSSHFVGRINRRFDAFQKQQIANMDGTLSDIKNYTLESIAAEKYFQSEKEQFKSLAARRREVAAKYFQKKDVSVGKEIVLPLEPKSVNKIPHNAEDFGKMTGLDSSASDDSGFITDRGFFVREDRFTDDYTAAVLADIPEDEMICPTTIRYGPEDAHEEIDFQLPGQSSDPKENQKPFKEDEEEEKEWLENYGTVDPSVPTSDKSCVGCGANFHCKNPSLPGFLPVELFVKLETKKWLEENLCRRCYLLKKHNFLLNVNVCNVDYRSLMRHLRLKQEALILLVVDMTDLPFSIFPDLPDIIGDKKPMIIVGNKVDLLPPDKRSGYLKHFRQALFDSVTSAGFSDRFNVLHTGLISAKTGFGVEDLITNIHLKWCSRGHLRSDIYLLGCTNAGKSTLFNTFLQSDLCKVRAMDIVDRATTSIWPGTTISLLKFPVMNPTPEKLELRRRRLLSNRAWELKEQRFHRHLFEETNDVKYATLQAHVGSTFKEQEDNLQPISFNDLRSSLDITSVSESKKKEKKNLKWNPIDRIFSQGNWCYDTPGTINEQQVLNLFTLDELIVVLPQKMILPRTFIVYPGESVLIGGIAKIDILEIIAQHRTAAFLSVFASDALPINVVKTKDVNRYYSKYLGTRALAVPFGDANRLSRFPELKGKEMEVTGIGEQEGVADVVLSSIGWVCITAASSTIKLIAFTPDGRGLALRQPPILPFCASQRGSRIPGTAGYNVRPIEFPVNEKRARLAKENAFRRKQASQQKAGD